MEKIGRELIYPECGHMQGKFFRLKSMFRLLCQQESGKLKLFCWVILMKCVMAALHDVDLAVMIELSCGQSDAYLLNQKF